MVVISWMLLMNAVMPKVISSERMATEMKRECAVIHCRMAICVSKVKTGTFIGVDRMKTMVMAPLMMPATNAATIAIL